MWHDIDNGENEEILGMFIGSVSKFTHFRHRTKFHDSIIKQHSNFKEKRPYDLAIKDKLWQIILWSSKNIPAY